jgi:hypothetical protein
MAEHRVFEEGPYYFTSIPQQDADGRWLAVVSFEFKAEYAKGGLVRTKVHTLHESFDDSDRAYQAGINFGYAKAKADETGL